MDAGSKHSLLRPEAVESFFILYVRAAELRPAWLVPTPSCMGLQVPLDG